MAKYFNETLMREMKVKLRRDDIPPFPEEPRIEQLGTKTIELFQAELFHYDPSSGMASGVPSGGPDVSKGIVVQADLKALSTDTEETTKEKEKIVSVLKETGRCSISGSAKDGKVNLRLHSPDRELGRSRQSSISQPGGGVDSPSTSTGKGRS